MLKRIWLIIAIVALTGCGLLGGDEAAPQATETVSAAPEATPVATPPGLSVPVAETPPATEPAGPPLPAALNVWMVQEISPRVDSPGGVLLSKQLSAYETNHPGLNLNVEVKATAGQGGMLSYLRSGRTVAPRILPDLVILPVDQMNVAVGEELIYPLDTYLPPDMVEDLYPAAANMARTNERIYAYPFTLANLTHLAYNTTALTTTVPITWENFINHDLVTFVFPAGGTSGAELLLQLYLASGGRLTDESGQPQLAEEPLTNALNLLARGRAEGLIPSASSNLTNLDESWQALMSGSANTVLTLAIQYGTQHNQTDGTGQAAGFAAIPGPERSLIPLVKGWAWAISTPDPTRQALAADLLNWLAAAPNLGDWSLAASRVPARRSAFEQWPVEEPYVQFVQSQIEQAGAFPANATSAVISVLKTALFDVMTLAKSPQVAAEEAVNALQP